MSLTLADIYKLFEKSQAEADRRSAEADRRSAEADRRSAEADRRYAEMDKLFEKSQAEADRRSAEADRRSAEADRRSAEADKRLAKLEQSVERTTKAVDGLSTRWGRFVEGLVEPAVLNLFQQRGIDIKYVYPRAKTRQAGLAMEIDILAVDDTVAILVECKSRLSKDDVDEFLIKLSRFKQSFPQYQNYLVHGAVAGIEIDEGIDRYAFRKGLFVIKSAGDSVAITNEPQFQPAAW